MNLAKIVKIINDRLNPKKKVITPARRGYESELQFLDFGGFSIECSSIEFETRDCGFCQYDCIYKNDEYSLIIKIKNDYKSLDFLSFDNCSHMYGSVTIPNQRIVLNDFFIISKTVNEHYCEIRASFSSYHAY